MYHIDIRINKDKLMDIRCHKYFPSSCIQCNQINKRKFSRIEFDKDLVNDRTCVKVMKEDIKTKKELYEKSYICKKCRGINRENLKKKKELEKNKEIRHKNIDSEVRQEIQKRIEIIGDLSSKLKNSMAELKSFLDNKYFRITCDKFSGAKRKPITGKILKVVDLHHFSCYPNGDIKDYKLLLESCAYSADFSVGEFVKIIEEDI
jgi:hypothetical protein